ncbi:hypothetical protein K450DRAFT_222359 [Umbelopsis ramanniana AG]|uniref:HTH La-type RNA-binding domain-containing protein n=1 Tax=Umbelopsis ramanniana AG TaxID=1314678 RepID=A0AAD5EHU8_UMBRA|nr:uncharacterized protein K450DRAFT_222359 [Umbelopsis ramanniana AG]KAI8583702.1 hypothetical protein K450DRAFT_222359 [Umbelopsis ramanniana AG]
MTASPTLSQSPTAESQASQTNSSLPSSGVPSPNIFNKKDKRQYPSSRQPYPPPPYPLPVYYPPYMLYPPYMYPHPPYLQPPQPQQPPLNQRDEDQDDVEIIMNDLEAPSSKFLDRSASVSSDVAKPVSPPEGVQPGLRNQLEYYFSRQNLANDAYLVSQMDSDLYVSIATVASFNKVKAWTTDYDTVVRALKSIPAVTVDETNTKVKPNISTQRTTIILRDIDSSATEEDITAIFTSDMEPIVIKDVKREIGNMWYVTFNTEEETIKMLFLLRGKSFKGKPIAGRIKSEAVLRNIQVENPSPQQTAVSPSFNPPSPSSNTPSPNNVQMPFPPYPGYYGLPGYPILPMMPPPMGWNSPQPPHLFQQNYNTQHGNYQEGHYRNNNNNNNRKRFNNNGAKYPQPIQQESSPQDRASTFSQQQQPGNFRNHTKKNNYRNQYNHGNNPFKNNNRTQQQTSRYGGNSIEESPVTQHELPSSTPLMSDTSGERPNHTPKGSSMPRNRGKKKKSDKKFPGKLVCAISDTSGHQCQQTHPLLT